MPEERSPMGLPRRTSQKRDKRQEDPLFHKKEEGGEKRFLQTRNRVSSPYKKKAA